MSKSKNKKKFSTIIILVLIFVLLISFVSGYFLLSYQRKKFNEQVALIDKKENYKIYIRECNRGDIIEIDTFNELKAIDKSYDV